MRKKVLIVGNPYRVPKPDTLLYIGTKYFGLERMLNAIEKFLKEVGVDEKSNLKN